MLEQSWSPFQWVPQESCSQAGLAGLAGLRQKKTEQLGQAFDYLKY